MHLLAIMACHHHPLQDEWLMHMAQTVFRTLCTSLADPEACNLCICNYAQSSTHAHGLVGVSGRSGAADHEQRCSQIPERRAAVLRCEPHGGALLLV